MNKNLIVSSLFLLTACSDSNIPDQDIEINWMLQSKLVTLNSVQLFKNPNPLTIQCEPFKPFMTGYYLISDNGKLSSDYAKWKCATELEHLKCPDLYILPKNGLASVHVTRGSIDEYSKADLNQCVVSAIQYAPEESMPTSKEVYNRNSWFASPNK